MFLSPLSSAWGPVRGAFCQPFLRFPQAAHIAVVGDHLVTVDSITKSQVSAKTPG